MWRSYLFEKSKRFFTGGAIVVSLSLLGNC
jgi:hypothetical protein